MMMRRRRIRIRMGGNGGGYKWRLSWQNKPGLSLLLGKVPIKGRKIKQSSTLLKKLHLNLNFKKGVLCRVCHKNMETNMENQLNIEGKLN